MFLRQVPPPKKARPQSGASMATQPKRARVKVSDFLSSNELADADLVGFWSKATDSEGDDERRLDFGRQADHVISSDQRGDKVGTDMPNANLLRVGRQKVGYDDPIPIDADQSTGKEKHGDEDEEVEEPLSEDEIGGGEIFRERKSLVISKRSRPSSASM